MKGTWDTNNLDLQSYIIAYSQIRDYEEMKEKEAEMKFMVKAIAASRGT